MKEGEPGGAGNMHEDEKCVTNLVENPEWKIHLGSPSRRWKDDIKRDLRRMGYEMWTGFNWISIGSSCGIS
jgi:hypothetical protein